MTFLGKNNLGNVNFVPVLKAIFAGSLKTTKQNKMTRKVLKITF